MTKTNLKPYSGNKEITASVELKLDTGVLSIVYSFAGETFSPPKKESKLMQRQDYLYENTCFELFLKPVNSEHYFEYHFALSGALNAYSLTHYRSSLTAFSDETFKGIKLEILSERSLKASIPLPESKEASDYLTNITAVYKNNEQTEYYALSHKKEKADFHNQELFLNLKGLI